MTSRTLQPRGAHIVIDGPDGVGISTQCDLLEAYLRGRGIRCATTTNPSAGPVGEMLRRMLLHKETALPPSTMQMAYVVDRAHNQPAVLAARARGDVVIQARGEWSTVVYNAARGRTEAESESLAETAFAWHAEIEIPTLTIVLNAPLEVTEARRAARGGAAELFDMSNFQARVIALYGDAGGLALLDEHGRYVSYPRRELPPKVPLISIDASGTEIEVHGRVLEAIDGLRIIPGFVTS